jgi:hypothetical protein
MTLVEVKKSNNPELEKELAKKHNKLRLDYLWIFANGEMLRAKYPNKYVAVKDQKVLYANEDAKRLITTITMAGEDINDFAVEYVHKKSTCFLL